MIFILGVEILWIWFCFVVMALYPCNNNAKEGEIDEKHAVKYLIVSLCLWNEKLPYQKSNWKNEIVHRKQQGQSDLLHRTLHLAEYLFLRLEHFLIHLMSILLKYTLNYAFLSYL